MTCRDRFSAALRAERTGHGQRSERVGQGRTVTVRLRVGCVPSRWGAAGPQ